jgi:hypothetical protein
MLHERRQHARNTSQTSVIEWERQLEQTAEDDMVVA